VFASSRRHASWPRDWSSDVCSSDLRGDPVGGPVAVRLRLRHRRPAEGRQTPMTRRSMPVPEGLAGLRVDAGLARLLGLSRTAVATLAETGGVEVDGAPVGKSDRLVAGAWLQVQLPEPAAPPQNTPAEVEGMGILYADDDLV